MTNIAILMAGRGSRVSSLGIPKPFLHYDNQYLYEMAIASAQSALPKSVFSIVLSQLNYDYAIRNEIVFPPSNVHVLQDFTDGPAESARRVQIDNQENFFTLDCDLVFDVTDFTWPESSDCHLFWFPSSNDSHSFIDLDNLKVKNIAEKERISDKGVIGFYGFRSKSFYDELYDQTSFKSEKFISEVIRTAIRLGYHVSASGANSHTPLGTIPEIKGHFAIE